MSFTSRIYYLNFQMKLKPLRTFKKIYSIKAPYKISYTTYLVKKYRYILLKVTNYEKNLFSDKKNLKF